MNNEGRLNLSRIMLLGISDFRSANALTSRREMRLTSKSVRNKEDCQRDVVFCACHVKILQQAFNLGVAYACQYAQGLIDRNTAYQCWLGR